MRYFSLEILIHRHWRQVIYVWGGKGFRDFLQAFGAISFGTENISGSNLFLTIDLNLLTLGFLSLNFSLVLIRNIFARRKKSSSGAKQTTLFIVPIESLIWNTNREVKVIGWLICCQHRRRSKDPQRAHFADPLRAAFRTNRDFFSPLNTRGTLQCFLRFQPLGQNPKRAKTNVRSLLLMGSCQR